MSRQPTLLRYLFFRVEGWFAVYGMILVLIALATLASNVRDTHRLQREGEETSANVLALDVYGIGDGKRFNVRFAFLHNGNWFENTAEVPEEVFAGLQVEGRIVVRYWGKDPTLVRLKAVPEPTKFLIVLMWGSFSVFGLAWTYGVLRRPLQIFWLSRNGIPLQAMVTGTKAASDDGKTSVAVWIEPGSRTGETSARPARKLPKVGSLITVLTDPSGKRPSVWDGDV